MAGRKLKWLTVGLFASTGAGTLALTSTLAAAPALADAGSPSNPAADLTWRCHGVGDGTQRLPDTCAGLPDAANNLYLGLPPDAAIRALPTPEGLYPITGVNSLPLDPSVALGEQALNKAILTTSARDPSRSSATRKARRFLRWR